MNKNLKIIIIGPTGVGKSTLLNKITGKYNPNDPALSTIGVDFGVVWDDDVKLQFWDTAGQERFKSIVDMYFKNVEFVILVYDLSDSYNMEEINSWINTCKDKIQNKDTPILLVGNKLDSLKIHNINLEDEFIKKNNIIGHVKMSCLNDNDYLSVKNFLMEYTKNRYRIEEEKIIRLTKEESNSFSCCYIL